MLLYVTSLLFTEVEVNSGGYLLSCKAVREISIAFTNTEVNNYNIIVLVYIPRKMKKKMPKTTLSVTIK